MMMAVEFALFFALLTYFHGNRGQPMDLQSRRSSAPAIPGKVVTSDPSKITSKSQGDAGTLTDMQDEEASGKFGVELQPFKYSFAPHLSRGEHCYVVVM